MDEVIADSYTLKWINPAEYAIDKIVCLQVTRLNYLLFRIPSACCRPRTMNPCTDPFPLHSPSSADTRSPVQLSTGPLCSLNPEYLQQPAPLGGLRRRNLPKCEFPFGPELPFSAADNARNGTAGPLRFLLHRDY